MVRGGDGGGGGADEGARGAPADGFGEYRLNE